MPDTGETEAGDGQREGRHVTEIRRWREADSRKGTATRLFPGLAGSPCPVIAHMHIEPWLQGIIHIERGRTGRSSLTLVIFFGHPTGTINGPEMGEARHCVEADALGPCSAQ